MVLSGLGKVLRMTLQALPAGGQCPSCESVSSASNDASRVVVALWLPVFIKTRL